MIQGLKQDSQWNGMVGMVVCHQQHLSRVEVLLPSGQRLAPALQNVAAPAAEISLVSGQSVLLNGILSRPELNGTTASVLRPAANAKGRYIVELPDKMEASIKADNLALLCG